MFSKDYTLPKNAALRIESDEIASLGKESEMLLRAHLPGLEEGAPSRPSQHIKLRHQQSDEPHFKQIGDSLLVGDTWDNLSKRDLQHLLYAVAREKFLKQGLYSVHSACVSNDSTILIVGHSGAGKTSTALELVENANWRMLSGNKTLVSFDDKSAIRVEAGTQTITAPKKFGDSYAASIGIDSFEYGERVAFLLEPERYLSASEQPIGAIVIPRIQEGVREVNEFGSRTALHKLIPFFLDRVNADTIITGSNTLYLGKTPEDKAQELAESLKVAVSEIPVFEVSGPLGFIAETAASIADRS